MINFGAGSRKSDLQRVVDEQKLKIDKYEQKLRDVIQAYKSLAAEKSALEESMKALNDDDDDDARESRPAIDSSKENNNGTDGNNDDHHRNLARNEDDAIERASIGSSVDTSFSENASSVEAKPSSSLLPPSSSTSDSGSKMAVLRRALGTITEEKSRQEKAFTADRRNLLQEIASVKEEMKSHEAESTKNEAVLRQQIQELRANLRQIQCERDCEQTDQAAMLKEMQEKLNQSRTQCESFQNHISTLSTDLKKKEQEPEESRRLIEQLLEENGRLKEKLDEAEKKLTNMPQMSRMQMELSQVKTQNATAIKEEEERSANAIRELSRFKENSERQVADLEAKIAELTSTVSDYERTRRQDLDIIEKLTSRVNELDQENTTLAKVTACRNCVDSRDENIQSMLDKLRKLFADLRRRTDSADYNGPPIDLYDVLSLENPNSEQTHSRCRKEYESLRDEFEKYKLRAQSALKNKTLLKDSSSISAEKRELDQLRRIVNDLQRSLAESQRQSEENESSCAELRKSIVQSKEEHRRELIDAQNQFKQQMSDLEAESSKQRERTLCVLTEKDKELETMRVILKAIRSTSPYEHHHGTESTTSAAAGAVAGRKSSSLTRTIVKSSSGTNQAQEVSTATDSSSWSAERQGSPVESIQSAGGGGCYETGGHLDGDSNALGSMPNMHLNHELARKEKLIDQLRRDIRQFETSLREVERSALTKELQHHDTIEKLKEEIRSLESKLSRYQITGESLEYLKNVLVQYMTCDDPIGKAHMLKAIGRAMHLTSKEIDTIQKHNARFYAGWWPGAKSK